MVDNKDNFRNKGFVDPNKYKYVFSKGLKEGETSQEWQDKFDSIPNNIKHADELTISTYKINKQLDEHNTHIGIGSWYVMLSQYFKDMFVIRNSPHNTPLRFSLFIIQDSRSGKNTNVNVIMRIAKRLGLKKVSPTSFTEKAILGMADTSAIEHNHKIRAKIKKDDGKYDESDLRDEFKKGLMENYDIILVEEAKNLFMGGHKDNLTIYIQEILDPKGEINVSTGTNGEWTRPVDCSFIMTTIPFESQDVEKRINDGFFQRFAMMKRKVEKKEFDERHDMYIDSYITSADFGSDELEQFAKEVSIELKKCKSIWDSRINNLPDDSPHIELEYDNETGEVINRKIKLELSVEASELMKKYKDDYKKMVKNTLFGDIVEKIDNFVPLFIELFVKVGSINSILHRDNDYKIKPDDIKYAKNLIVDRTFRGVIDLINNLGKKQNEINLNYSRIVGDEWTLENYILNRIASVGRMNMLNTKNKLNELVNKNYVEKKVIDKTGEVYYRCTEKVFKLIINIKDLEEYSKHTTKVNKLINKEPKLKYLILFLQELEKKKIKYDNSTFKTFNKIFYNKFDNNYSKLQDKLRNNGILPHSNKNSFKLMSEAEKIEWLDENEKQRIYPFLNECFDMYEEFEKEYLNKKGEFTIEHIVEEQIKIKKEKIKEKNLKVPEEFNYQFDDNTFIKPISKTVNF